MSVTMGRDYAAYDVYRAECSRLGLTIRLDGDYDADIPNPHTMHASIDELYMEFGDAERIEHNLPDEITSFDGLGVEVHLHVYCSVSSAMGNVFPNRRFKIGICEHRIPEGSAISYANRPDLAYRPGGKPLVTDQNNWYCGYKDVTEANLFTGDDGDIEEVVIYSTQSYPPVEVLNAIKNTAIVLMQVPEYVGDTDGLGEVKVYTTGQYAPYVEIVYGIVRPDVDYLTDYSTPCSGAYINPNSPDNLSVAYRCEDATAVYGDRVIILQSIIGGSVPHKSTTVEFAKVGGEVFESVHDYTLNISIPEKALDFSQFLWKPTVENVLGGKTTATEWNLATTVDSIPETLIVAPKNTIVNVDKVAVFDWEHTIATGTNQTKFDLQLLIDGTWTTILEAETAETMATVPAGLLSSRATAWRVRTANNDGVYGEYSESAKIILVVASSVIDIMVTGNVRPTVAWQAADQAGYEVKVDGVTMGTHYGAEKSYMWPYLLEDGQHSIKVRIINRYGLYSQWVEIIHHVTNVPQEVAPVLTAAMVGNADVQLMWAGEGAAETLVYRDGELIGRAQSAGVYVDHIAYDEHVYRVRVVAADSNYTDSNEVRIAVPLRETMLAAVGEWNWIELAYSATAEPPVRTAELMPLYALNYYSGREKPVAEMSRHKSATYSVTYAVTEQQAAQLRGMMGKIVVHKRKGELIRGLLQSVSEARTWWGVDLTLQIVEVDEG